MNAIVFGAGSGVGRATVTALLARGDRVRAVARHAPDIAGADNIAADATDPAAVARVLEGGADLVVVSVGVQAKLAPLDEQTWESFSEVWNGDLQASFHVGQYALRHAKKGTTVVFVSSGAGLGGSPLSGGYAGAKRMQMFLAGYLAKLSDARGSGVRYAALVPRQFIAGTTIAAQASAAYKISMDSFEAPLTPEACADAILRIAAGDAPAAPILTIAGARGLEAL